MVKKQLASRLAQKKTDANQCKYINKIVEVLSTHMLHIPIVVFQARELDQ